jgi:DNA modification methylase
MTISVGRVGMVPISSVIVAEDRAREDMGDLNALELNMKESGLITPLAMKDLNDGTFLLLAGERRFTVLSRNQVPEIPARIYDQELSELEMKIIEKSENFHRKEMEFWEMDQLTAEIHELKQQVHGVATPGPSTSGWSKNDTARELGIDRMTVTNSLQRNKLRSEHPEIFAHCKTASDADKLIKKVTKAVETNIQARQIEAIKSNTTIQNLISRFVINDFFKGVKNIPDETIDFIEIDPPYSIDLNNIKHKDSNVSQYIEEDYNEIPTNKYSDFLHNLFKECYRVMKPNSWLVCWFGMHPWFETVYQEIIDSGLKANRLCGIWTKTLGQSNNPSILLANAYETFFYAKKGNPELNKPGSINVFTTPIIPATQKIHPTEKPVELMKEIYSIFVSVNSNILIPFLGSGNGLIASYQLGLNGVGFEKSKNYKDSFIVRIHNGMEYLK